MYHYCRLKLYSINSILKIEVQVRLILTNHQLASHILHKPIHPADWLCKSMPLNIFASFILAITVQNNTLALTNVH